MVGLFKLFVEAWIAENMVEVFEMLKHFTGEIGGKTGDGIEFWRRNYSSDSCIAIEYDKEVRLSFRWHHDERFEISYHNGTLAVHVEVDEATVIVDAKGIFSAFIDVGRIERRTVALLNQ